MRRLSIFVAILALLVGITAFVRYLGTGKAGVVAPPLEPRRSDQPPAGLSGPPMGDRSSGLPPIPRVAVPRINVSFRSILLRVLETHRKTCDGLRGHICHRSMPFFAGQQASGRSELRLLALAFPAESLETAQRILASTPRNAADSEAALWILTVLGENGNEMARGGLLAAGLGSDPDSVSLAIDLVVRTSELHYFRPVFIKRSSEGDLGAIIALARIVDDEARRVLQQLSADQTYVGTLAKEALEMQSLPTSAEWPKVFEDIIKGVDPQRKQWMWWALEAGRQQPFPKMMGLMRERLDASKKSYREKFVEENENLRSDGGLVDAGFERELKRTFSVDRIDPYYRHVLLAYSTMGGELSASERGHLNLMGYGGDPTKLLADIQSDDPAAEARDQEIQKKLQESPGTIPEWFRNYLK